MKKALKISTYCLLVSIIIAIGLCYIIIPERTKWAFDIVVDYINRPLGIVCGTTITLGVVAYFVFSIITTYRKTSVRQDIEKFSGLVESKSLELRKLESELKTKESEIKALLSNYSQRIDNLTELLVKVCETSPNAKIKAIGQDIYNTQVEIKHDLEQKQDLIEKYSDKELTELIEKVAEIEKVVKTYGERKETTND